MGKVFSIDRAYTVSENGTEYAILYWAENVSEKGNTIATAVEEKHWKAYLKKKPVPAEYFFYENVLEEFRPADFKPRMREYAGMAKLSESDRCLHVTVTADGWKPKAN